MIYSSLFGWKKFAEEIEIWADHELIPEFTGTTLADDVLSNIFQTIRYHLEERSSDSFDKGSSSDKSQSS